MRLRMLLAGALVLAAGARLASAQTERPVRIGVFDSRAIAVAWANSDEFRNSIGEMKSAQAKAKADGDTKRAAELEQQGQWMQVRLHQQGFSTATVSAILAKVKDQLPAIAADARAVMLVSKWEVPFQGAGVETVDVTMPMVRLFHPSERTLRIVDEMKSVQPMAFDELPLDPNL